MIITSALFVEIKYFKPRKTTQTLNNPHGQQFVFKNLLQQLNLKPPPTNTNWSTTVSQGYVDENQLDVSYLLLFKSRQ